MKTKKQSVKYAVVIMMLISTVVIGIQGGSDRNQGGEQLWVFDADLFVKHIRSADLTGDGIDDIIAAEYDSDSYDALSKVYGIDGVDGQSLWDYTVDSGARSMTIGDINNDGTMDAVIGTSLGLNTPDGKVHVIDGSTGGIIWVFTPGGSGDTIGDVAVGDFNGDAYSDVAVACWDDFVYAIDGETGDELWSYEVGSIFINAVDTSDVNGDGMDDVVYAHEYLPGYDNEIGVLDGTNGAVIWNEIIASTPERAIMADIDNDGTVEAIFGVVTDDDMVQVEVRDGFTGNLEWSADIGQGPGSVNPTIYLLMMLIRMEILSYWWAMNMLISSSVHMREHLMNLCGNQSY